MAQLPDFITDNPELQRLWVILRGVLQNVSSDNFKAEVVQGTTSGSVDSERKFSHSLGAVPSLQFFLEGDVYIPFKGRSSSSVDVRSSKTSEQFRLLLIL